MSLEGLEPSRVLPRRILSPLRMPIPPQARVDCCSEHGFYPRGVGPAGIVEQFDLEGRIDAC